MTFKDPKITEILNYSGWYDDRIVNREAIIDQYKANGYPILEKVITFMESFYGIVINFININGTKDNISFDLAKAIDLEALERVVEEYEPRVGSRMCIIGTAHREYFVLLMDENGVVYGGYDHFFVKISDSGQNAIESIINGIKGAEIK